MAKKTNDELFSSFVADVLSTVPADQRATFEQTLKSDSVAAKMKESVLARADYSRQMDELKTVQSDVEREVTEARTRIAEWEQWYGKASQEVAKATEKSKLYETKYGPLDSNNSTNHKPSLTEEEFTKRLTDELNKHDQAAIAFANDLTRVQVEYLKEFKDVLDTDVLIADASKKGLTLKQAYQDFIAPKVKEREEKRFNEALEKAKEEGRREGNSNRLPFASGPTEPHVLDSINRTDVPRTDTDRIAAAVKGWSEIRNNAH